MLIWGSILVFIGTKIVPKANQRAIKMHQQVDLVSGLHKRREDFFEISIFWRHVVDFRFYFGAHWILRGSPNRWFSDKSIEKWRPGAVPAKTLNSDGKLMRKGGGLRSKKESFTLYMLQFKRLRRSLQKVSKVDHLCAIQSDFRDLEAVLKDMKLWWI